VDAGGKGRLSLKTFKGILRGEPLGKMEAFQSFRTGVRETDAIFYFFGAGGFHNGQGRKLKCNGMNTLMGESRRCDFQKERVFRG